jgi:MFS family permease
MYVGAIGVMGIGMLLASMAPTLWVAAPLACAATVGNGAAIVCNQLFIQRGAPDQMRGRAVAVLMSSTYATLAIAMGVAGVLTGVFGGRAMWAIGGAIWLCCSVAALAMTRDLGVAVEERAGRLTGRCLDGDCSGAEKVRRIRERFDLSRYTLLYAYGDTPDDREMLDLADRKYYRGREVSSWDEVTEYDDPPASGSHDAESETGGATS